VPNAGADYKKEAIVIVFSTKDYRRPFSSFSDKPKGGFFIV
jgi:hypothetical protein